MVLIRMPFFASSTFRMQAQTPKLVDLSEESEATLDLYGITGGKTDTFGRHCLLARRFAEAGVRFVQVSLGGWDHHGKISAGLKDKCAESDRPVAGLRAYPVEASHQVGRVFAKHATEEKVLCLAR